jgi:tRNA-dihydrouridine synthase A
MAREKQDSGTHWPGIARHMLGLRHGQPGGRLWRQVWSDHRLRDHTPHSVMTLAHARMRGGKAAELLPHAAPAHA